MNKLKLKENFEKILVNKKYYLPIRRNKKINYQNYYKNVTDPDGKKRNLIKEKKSKIKQFKIILDYLNTNRKKKKILDLGCGYGWMLSELDKKLWLRHGVEISKDCYSTAKKNMEFIEENIESYKDNFFDVVTAIHLIEHIKDPLKYLKKIKQKIKKNGTIIIETPDFDSEMARMYKDKFRLLHDKTHISLFSLDSLTRMLRDQGFEIFKIEFPFFETPFFNKTNINKLFHKKKSQFSPPFYGSVMTIFAKKK